MFLPTLFLLRQLESNYSISRPPAMRTFQIDTSQKAAWKIWPTSCSARQGRVSMETHAPRPADRALHSVCLCPRYYPGVCCFSTCIGFRQIQFWTPRKPFKPWFRGDQCLASVMERQHRFPRELRDKENPKADIKRLWKAAGGVLSSVETGVSVTGAVCKLMTHPQGIFSICINVQT